MGTTVDTAEWLAERFEENRRHLRAVALRMLGSAAEADRAVAESWFRLSRNGGGRSAERCGAADSLTAWLTTVVAGIALTMLKSRSRVRSLEALHTSGPARPEPILPEHETLLADSVGLALLTALETLRPAECLAFVLHDLFAVPFDDIAVIVDESPADARRLASHARRRVHSVEARPSRTSKGSQASEGCTWIHPTLGV